MNEVSLAGLYAVAEGVFCTLSGKVIHFVRVFLSNFRYNFRAISLEVCYYESSAGEKPGEEEVAKTKLRMGEEGERHGKKMGLFVQ